MVRELERILAAGFPENAPVAYPVFYRTYSRRSQNRRESWAEVCDRTLRGLVALGNLTDHQAALIDRMQRSLMALSSGRWLWVGGTPWIEKPTNFFGGYNCTSTNVIDWRAFGLMMDLAMQGCGTGAVLESQYIEQLPVIKNYLHVAITGRIGATEASLRREETQIDIDSNHVRISVGDSRKGWVTSYQTVLELSSDDRFPGEVFITVDVSDIRPSGETLKGFGGVANPIKLPGLYQRCADILNKSIGRQLNSLECCLLIDEAAVCIVAGNIRRSAGIRQGNAFDDLFSNAKNNLWQQDAKGNWQIDPQRDALRMANHTRVFHRKPTLEETIGAVRKQYYSGEGAIQWAGEAIARSSADILPNLEVKREFLQSYSDGKGKEWMTTKHPELTSEEIEHRLQRYGLNPCVTGDTWVHTGEGPRQVKELIGIQHSTYINGELFSTTPDGFFYSGHKPVIRLTTQEGYSLKLTENHRLLKLTAQTPKKQYTDWVPVTDLKVGDRILLHNHRELQPWDGEGSFASGWLLGNLVGDGSQFVKDCESLCSLEKNPWNDRTLLRFWQDSQDEMSQYAVQTLAKTAGYQPCYDPVLKHPVIDSADLGRLAEEFGIAQGHQVITNQVEQGSYDFYRGFLRGLFDADGSVQGSQQKGISLRLSQSNLPNLQAVQRMLARLGIISTIDRERRSEGYQLLPDSQWNSALYFGKTCHELVIANNNLQEFQQLIGFQEPQKAARLDQVLATYKRQLNRERFTATIASLEPDGVEAVFDCTVPGPDCFDANGFVAHNCGEIIGSNFFCNLSEVHLNLIDPRDYEKQEDAFTAAALSVATLLNHRFVEDRYRRSRELDPIVGVSFTGLFDFFVKAFGVAWLEWWTIGRPENEQGKIFQSQEAAYLNHWREIVHGVVWDYCDSHHLKRPNRCTTVQPSGTKALLTNASPGWHPPKSARYIRRITCRKNDPVALACLDYGYSIVPSQSDKDDRGNLLNDPFDPRCTEWLVEIPVQVPWADIPGADGIDISKFSALAQFDFYMQVQKFYSRHNTSATIELRENEIEALGTRIYEAIRDDEGYISAALLSRFDDLQTFPRLPFEPIDKSTYDRLVTEVEQRRKVRDFHSALERYDRGEMPEAGPAGCDSDACLMSEEKK